MSDLTPDPSSVASWRGHVIVCGLHDEGLRVVEQLQSAGVPVVVVDDAPNPRLVRVLDELAVPYLAADSRLPETLSAVGLETAAALICAETDDLHTMATALLVRELVPGIRVVVQLRNPAVGRALEALGVAVLDVARLSAPTFVEACLGSSERPLVLGDETFTMVQTLAPRTAALRELYGDLAPIAVIHAGSARVESTPGRDYVVTAGDTVAVVGRAAAVRAAGLGRAAQPREVAFVGSRAPRPAQARRAALLGTIARSLDRRLKLALVSLFALVAVSITVLMLGYREPDGTRMSLVDALYFTTETVGTVGFGDFYFRDQHVWLRLWAIALMVIGATLATVFFALLTNMLVSRRIAESLGLRRITGMSDHIVLIGAGAVGIAVAGELSSQGQSVVAIEADEENRFLVQLRALDVPIVLADATVPETLAAAKLDRARAVAVLTSSDLVNIETGLAVRDLLGERWSEVPVVLRLFDRRLARTVESGFDFRYVRSPAALAAPWFVGAALGLDVLETFYVGDQPLLVARLVVSEGGRLDGLTMRSLPARLRVVSLVQGEDRVRTEPRRDTALRAGDSAYVVGPYEELLRLLRADAVDLF
ncbi:MAG TPA: NAD-binding protein [Marmoricola sp.]|nr:NAD-binding protein [Marmoricola sp.]